MKLHTLALVSALTVALVCIHATQAAYCHGKPDPNAPANNLPFWTQPPTLVRTVPNGKLFTVGGPDDRVYVIHVYGTAKEMGQAHGALMKEEISTMLQKVYNYIYEQIDQDISFLPKSLRHLVEEYGLDAALDLQVDATKPWTPQYWFDEIEGLAEGAGVPYNAIRNLQYLGEITRGACSMMGAWEEAVNGTTLISTRQLDWDIDNPIRDFPAVVIYHPKDAKYPELHTAINVGWVGWVGALTGMSEDQLSISEIGVTYPDDTFGKETRFGVPFVVLLKDILLVDKTLEDSITRIQNAKRTCKLILGVGDAKNNGSFRGFEYSATVANVISDQNLMPVNDTWHPKIPKVVYFGMDWLCPPYSETLASHIKANYGRINANIAAREIIARTETGNMHSAIYDMHNGYMYVANTRRSDVSTGAIKAFARTYIRYNVKALFAETMEQ